MIHLIFILVLCLVHTAIASTRHNSVPSQSTRAGDSLALRMLQYPVYDPEVYSQAIVILESLRSAPSCHRAATISLIDSCQSLETSEGGNTLLSEVREKYAARLAMCELMGAKVQLPSQCEIFTMSERHCKRKNSGSLMSKFRRASNIEHESTAACFAETSLAHLNHCLGAIHNKPQWWTSYSNALQNVLIVCQASRGAVEQGKQIFLSHYI
jgi:hypothetical protein